MENVVYAPKNPINRAERNHRAMVNRSVRRVNRNPSTRAPLMLTTKVPQGNAPPRRLPGRFG